MVSKQEKRADHESNWLKKILFLINNKTFRILCTSGT